MSTVGAVWRAVEHENTPAVSAALSIVYEYIVYSVCCTVPAVSAAL
jgi:hypothetical protein